MRIDAAGALALVEHRTRDVARQTFFTLRERQRCDSRVDLGACLCRERVEPFAEQVPLLANEPGDGCETMAAEIAATATRPPRMLTRGGAGTAVDVFVDGEEALSRHGG